MRLGAKPPSRSFQHRRQCHPLSPGRCHSMPPSNLHAMLPVLSALPQRCSCGPCPLQGCRTPPASPPALQCALLPVWGLWGCSCTHLWALPGQSRTGPKHLHSAGGSQVIPVSGGRLSPLPAAGKGPLGLGCRHPHPPGKAPRPPGSGPAVPGEGLGAMGAAPGLALGCRGIPMALGGRGGSGGSADPSRLRKEAPARGSFPGRVPRRDRAMCRAPSRGSPQAVTRGGPRGCRGPISPRLLSSRRRPAPLPPAAEAPQALAAGRDPGALRRPPGRSLAPPAAPGSSPRLPPPPRPRAPRDSARVGWGGRAGGPPRAGRRGGGRGLPGAHARRAGPPHPRGEAAGDGAPAAGAAGGRGGGGRAGPGRPGDGGRTLPAPLRRTRAPGASRRPARPCRAPSGSC